jgi:uncharacterized protein
MFILIVFGVLGLIYGYSGWRIILPLRLSLPGNLVAGIALVVLLVLPIIVLRLRSSASGHWWYDLLTWIAFLGLGFAILTFSLLVIRDLAWLGASGLDRILSLSGRPPSSSLLPAAPDRRLFLLNALNLGVVGLSAGLAGYGLYAARSHLRIFEVSIPIRGLPPAMEGFRIAQISDIHVGLTIKGDYLEKVVEKVEGLAPDLIALTGDLIDGEVEHLRHQVSSLERLNAPCGCFFVTGNHEYYNSNPPAWIAEIERLGFTVLINEHRLVETSGERFLIAGVTDHSAGAVKGLHAASNPQAALGDAPPGLFRLLLAHQPLSIFAAAKAGFDLQLSGHTHGGQFIPWKYAIPLQQPFVAGLHRYENTWIYVNRGTGYWGPPLRLDVPAEISLITLTRAQEPPA